MPADPETRQQTARRIAYIYGTDNTHTTRATRPGMRKLPGAASAYNVNERRPIVACRCTSTRTSTCTSATRILIRFDETPQCAPRATCNEPHNEPHNASNAQASCKDRHRAQLVVVLHITSAGWSSYISRQLRSHVGGDDSPIICTWSTFPLVLHVIVDETSPALAATRKHSTR